MHVVESSEWEPLASVPSRGDMQASGVRLAALEANMCVVYEYEYVHVVCACATVPFAGGPGDRTKGPASGDASLISCFAIARRSRRTRYQASGERCDGAHLSGMREWWLSSRVNLFTRGPPLPTGAPVGIDCSLRAPLPPPRHSIEASETSRRQGLSLTAYLPSLYTTVYTVHLYSVHCTSTVNSTLAQHAGQVGGDSLQLWLWLRL